MSRALCFLSMWVCLAPAVRADSFATQQAEVFQFPTRQLSTVPDGYFQPQFYGTGSSPQIFMSRTNAGGELGSARANSPAHIPIPEPATLALLGTGFVFLSLGLRSLRAKIKFGN